MGYREKSVAIDTRAYYNMFNSLTNISVADNYNDPGFYKIAYLLMKIKKDPYFPILIFSIISNFIVVYRLWDFRKYCNYYYAILRYITLFYFYSYNCMRQFLSMSIIFFATKYLEKKEYIKFGIFILIASYIHIAALTSVLYIALEKFKWSNLNRKEKNVINLSYILSPIAIYLILNKTSGRIENYFSTISTIGGRFSYILKIFLFICFTIITYKNYKNNYDNITENEVNISRRMMIIYYFLGMAFTGLGFIWAQFERISYYYYLYAMVYVGTIANEKRYRILFRTMLLFVLFRSFYLSCTQNVVGQMPYLFNWE